MQTLQILGAGSVHLRNNNAAQAACLSETLGASGDTACQAWRSCLAASKKADALLGLLKAARVHTTEIATERSDKTCLDPATEDPESWTCDCYDSMRDRCVELAAEVGAAYSSSFESVCLRAEYCVHPKICSGWKAAACSREDLIDDFDNDNYNFTKLKHTLSDKPSFIYKTAGKHMADALIERASVDAAIVTVSNRSSGLDDSTGTKACL